MPTKEQETQIESCLATYRSVLQGKVFYLSTPITGGKMFYDALERIKKNSPGPPTDVVKDVIAPNVKAAQLNVRYLRTQLMSVVVCPAECKNPGWDQETWLTFWGKMLTEFVHTVIMTPGWEYSNGCIWEYLYARHAEVANGYPIAVIDFDTYQPIHSVWAKALLKRAKTDLSARDLSTMDQDDALQDPYISG